MTMNSLLLRCNHCVSLQPIRSISVTNPHHGKKNFKKFVLVLRGTEAEKKQQKENPDPDMHYTNYSVRDPLIKHGNKKLFFKENIPELVVPDLTGCPLKPYVSYRTAEIEQSEFTPKDLFESVYAPKIFEDYKASKLDEQGNPLEPSPEEKLTIEEAKNNALKCRSDMFNEINPYIPRGIREGKD